MMGNVTVFARGRGRQPRAPGSSATTAHLQRIARWQLRAGGYSRPEARSRGAPFEERLDAGKQRQECGRYELPASGENSQQPLPGASLDRSSCRAANNQAGQCADGPI
jgi:hypothetical protein